MFSEQWFTEASLQALVIKYSPFFDLYPETDENIPVPLKPKENNQPSSNDDNNNADIVTPAEKRGEKLTPEKETWQRRKPSSSSTHHSPSSSNIRASTSSPLLGQRANQNTHLSSSHPHTLGSLSKKGDYRPPATRNFVVVGERACIELRVTPPSQSLPPPEARKLLVRVDYCVPKKEPPAPTTPQNPGMKRKNHSEALTNSSVEGKSTPPEESSSANPSSRPVSPLALERTLTAPPAASQEEKKTNHEFLPASPRTQPLRKNASSQGGALAAGQRQKVARKRKTFENADAPPRIGDTREGPVMDTSSSDARQRSSSSDSLPAKTQNRDAEPATITNTTESSNQANAHKSLLSKSQRSSFKSKSVADMIRSRVSRNLGGNAADHQEGGGTGERPRTTLAENDATKEVTKTMAHGKEGGESGSVKDQTAGSARGARNHNEKKAPFLKRGSASVASLSSAARSNATVSNAGRSASSLETPFHRSKNSGFLSGMDEDRKKFSSGDKEDKYISVVGRKVAHCPLSSASQAFSREIDPIYELEDGTLIYHIFAPVGIADTFVNQEILIRIQMYANLFLQAEKRNPEDRFQELCNLLRVGTFPRPSKFARNTFIPIRVLCPLHIVLRPFDLQQQVHLQVGLHNQSQKEALEIYEVQLDRPLRDTSCLPPDLPISLHPNEQYNVLLCARGRKAPLPTSGDTYSMPKYASPPGVAPSLAVLICWSLPQVLGKERIFSRFESPRTGVLGHELSLSLHHNDGEPYPVLKPFWVSFTLSNLSSRARNLMVFVDPVSSFLSSSKKSLSTTSGQPHGHGSAVEFQPRNPSLQLERKAMLSPQIGSRTNRGVSENLERRARTPNPSRRQDYEDRKKSELVLSDPPNGKVTAARFLADSNHRQDGRPHHQGRENDLSKSIEIVMEDQLRERRVQKGNSSPLIVLQHCISNILLEANGAMRLRIPFLALSAGFFSLQGLQVYDRDTATFYGLMGNCFVHCEM